MPIEQREVALRLNPSVDAAHLNLSAALGAKGDWDGTIAEEREALRSMMFEAYRLQGGLNWLPLLSTNME